MKTETNWGQIYADRAQQSAPEPERGIVVPRVREGRDMVYNGTMPPPENEAQSAPMPGVTRNRRTTKRKFSPFNVILLLLSIAIVSVLYISNILAVGRLMRQINILDQTHVRLVNEQELLRAQINRLSSLERINQDVAAQLGLGTPTTTPVWLDVDRARVAELEEAVAKAGTK